MRRIPENRGEAGKSRPFFTADRARRGTGGVAIFLCEKSRPALSLALSSDIDGSASRFSTRGVGKARQM